MENLEDIKKQALAEIQTEAQKAAEKHAKEVVEKELAIKNAEFEKTLSGKTDEEISKMRADFSKQIADLSAEVKKNAQTTDTKTAVIKSLSEMIYDTILENTEKLQKASGSNGEMKERLISKTVADMGITTHTTNFTPYIQEVRNDLIQTPHNRVWLADLLPQATANGNSIIFPKENGGEGDVALWTTGNKEQLDFDLTTQQVSFKWIAGFVVVEREMLDDIKFLASYLAEKLYTKLKIKENAFILNGDAGTYKGIKDLAKAYNGSYTTLGEKIIDATYGQIPTATYDYYVGNNVLVNPRTAVKIGLAKADGSGEFNLPAGSIGFANGKLNIGGINTTTTTDIEADKFIAFDSTATMFVRRMLPELEMFVDATLAKTNKVMFRIEERVGLAVFNDDALVKIA